MDATLMKGSPAFGSVFHRAIAGIAECARVDAIRAGENRDVRQARVPQPE
jgi:hypothetical protein